MLEWPTSGKLKEVMAVGGGILDSDSAVLSVLDSYILLRNIAQDIQN